MTGELPLPAFRFLPEAPSVWRLFRQGIGDVGSCIPDTILKQRAIKLPGPGGPLVLADPDAVRSVLVDRAAAFDRDRFIRRLFRRAWGKGIAAAEGADWQRQRKAASPFFRPSAVAAQVQAFAREGDRVAATLPGDQPCDLNALARDAVSGVVFSVLVDARGSIDRDAVARDVPGYIDRIIDFGALDLLPLPERLIDRLRGIDRDERVIRIRAAARRLADTRGDGAMRSDMIAMMDGQGPAEDNIAGLIPAAMDTTVHALAWSLFVLARRPAWQEQVAAEARAAGGDPTLDQLSLTRRVVQEVLRLYPPAPLLARCAAQAQELAGFKIRRGQTVLVAAYAMHRHPDLWDRPDVFDPDRFLPDAGPHPGYIPFGTGPRMCIAAQFALAEVAVILARLVNRFHWSPAGAEPVLSLRTTTHALNGLCARPSLRKP